MPKRQARAYKKRGTRRRKTAWYNKKYSIKQVAGKALAGVRYLKGLINAEKHMRDFDWSYSAITTPMTAQHLTALPVGDADNERTGNSVLVKYHLIRFTINRNSAAAHTSDNVRIVVVCDNQQRADSAPIYGDVFQGDSYQAHINRLNRGRFSIMYDKMFSVFADKPTLMRRIVLRNNKHARFNGSAGTDIEKCGIYVLCVGSIATNGPTVLFNARTAWYDN